LTKIKLKNISRVCVTGSLVLYVCFVDHCLSLCPFFLATVFSVLRITDYDYPFGILDLLIMITPLVS